MSKNYITLLVGSTLRDEGGKNGEEEEKEKNIQKSKPFENKDA